MSLISYQPVLKTLFSRMRVYKYFLSPPIEKILYNDYKFVKKQHDLYFDRKSHLTSAYKYIYKLYTKPQFKSHDIIAYELHEYCSIYNIYRRGKLQRLLSYQTSPLEDYVYEPETKMFVQVFMKDQEQRKFLKKVCRYIQNGLSYIAKQTKIPLQLAYNEVLKNTNNFLITIIENQSLQLDQKIRMLFQIHLIQEFYECYVKETHLEELYATVFKEVNRQLDVNQNYTPKNIHKQFLYDCVPYEYNQQKVNQQNQSFLKRVFKVVQNMSQENYDYNSIWYVKQNMDQIE